MALTALGATAVVVALDRLDAARPVTERCTALLDGEPWHLSPAQADNAALIVAAPLRRDFPARAATIGIATALQESRMINIDYGDRDSVGLFQQRPSQGWGSVEEIMDPVYSTNLFYDVLETIDGYEDMEVTVAAQAVQRSGFPDAYAQHESRSRAWASALTGHSTAALSCELAPVPEDTGDSEDQNGEGESGPPVAGTSAEERLEALTARVERDLVDLRAVPEEPAEESTEDGPDGDVPDGARSVLVDARPLPGGTDDPERLTWAVAQWAVAVAWAQDVVAVELDGARWDRESARWELADGAQTEAGDDSGSDAPGPGLVRITVAGS